MLQILLERFVTHTYLRIYTCETSQKKKKIQAASLIIRQCLYYIFLSVLLVEYTKSFSQKRNKEQQRHPAFLLLQCLLQNSFKEIYYIICLGIECYMYAIY